MRQNASQQTVQIQEPTLREINKHRGWFAGSCITGSGCIVLFIGAIYLTFRIVVGSGPSTLTDFPTDFPKDIPQTNVDKIINIVSIDAVTRDRAVWVATAIPRLLSAPVLAEINPDAQIIEEHDSLGRVNFTRQLTHENYLSYLGLPNDTNQNKTVIVTWNGIKTYPSILADTFENQLSRAGYKVVEATTPGQNEARFSFSKDAVTGTFQAIDLHPDEPGIEFVNMVVNY
ncbi:MAG: hypothetical protein NT003_01910 [Candidatus Magasanikbacteria bacterium]|nr:hypothetical protein [Candidatus Magasanikbacteria bacterium]